MIQNPIKVSYYKPAPMVQRPGARRRHWSPGTQALREVRNYIHMTNLLSLKAPFLWNVKHVGHN